MADVVPDVRLVRFGRYGPNGPQQPLSAFAKQADTASTATISFCQTRPLVLGIYISRCSSNSSPRLTAQPYSGMPPVRARIRPHPMAIWRTARQLFVEEQAFTDNRPGPEAHCGHCKTRLASQGGRFFVCITCSEFLCHSCCTTDHKRRPLHMLKVCIIFHCEFAAEEAQEWTGGSWETTTLADIGFVYQLGHPGRHCHHPDPDVHSMRVFDTTGVHTVKYRFCTCLLALPHSEQILSAGWHAPGDQADVCETWGLLAQMSNLGTCFFFLQSPDSAPVDEKSSDVM
ncbi:hypothetical protein DFH06DRAFT_1318538 [Mycena polygramma]|nr:hypothetical protein DFH06DRAFT_1318538 [Mycena polygramma]